MAENVGTIYYTVEADTSKVVNGVSRVDGVLHRVEQRFGQTDRAAARTEFQLTKTAAAVQGLGREAQGAAAPLGNLGRLLGGLLTLQGANMLTQMAEGYNEMAERIRMATASQEEYEEVQRRLLATANGTYRSLAEAQEVYIQTADALRSMGYTTDQVLDITDSMSYAFVKNATSVQRAQSAMNAYTSAIMKGKVEAQGWQSIIAAIPTVIQDIADAAGLSAEEVRRLGSEGKLTAQQLNEGLRKSLEANKKAADDMATTVKDAFTALRNSLSVYLGELNQSTEATGLLADAIKTMAENIDVVVAALTAAGAGVMARYIAQLGAQAVASGRASMAARAQAAAELHLAQQHAATTAAALAQAQANAALSGMQAGAARAADAHTAALARLQAAKAAATAAGRGLVAVLGGPLGIIALAGAAGLAMAAMGREARDAVPDIDSLTESLGELGKAQLQVRRDKAEDAVETLARQASEADAQVKALQRDLEALNRSATQGRGIDADGLRNANRELNQALADREDLNRRLGQAIEAQDRIMAEQRRRDEQPSGPSGTRSDPEVQKRLQALRDELELAKLTGEARAKLRAIQKLGENATKEEREEAERLAAEIYRLEEAQKALTKTTKDAAKEREKALEDDAKVLDKLAASLMTVGMNAEDAAAAAARMSLSEYATPEQIARVGELARLIHRIQEGAKFREKIEGEGVLSYVLGDVEPLRGGYFDEQFARYEAEEKAEIERYQKQADRLKEALEARAITMDRYHAIFEEMSRTHSQRMAQIEQAKNASMLSSASGFFGEMASALEGYTGKASGAYRALFVLSKGFAIANAALNLQTAVSQALADPTAVTPAQKFANMAAIMAAGGQLVSSIAGINYGGGRQYGGPVNPGSMYRINEAGHPEVLQMGGRRYLLPGSEGGTVKPMEKGGSGAGGGINVTVQLIEDRQRAGQVEQSRGQGQDADYIIKAFVANIRNGGDADDAIRGTYGLDRMGV